jgi:predicted phage terminase large subunit-like protein
MWPEWFNADSVRRFRKTPRTWRSLFQQTPTADDGIYFKREWFGWYDKAPENLNTYITLDSAETQDGGDYTFIIVWGVCPEGNVYVLDLWRGQVETDKWVEVLLKMVAGHSPLAQVPEVDNIFMAVKPFIRKRMRDSGIRCAIQSMPHGSKAKTVRAQAFQGIAALGQVHFPRAHPLSEMLLDQLLKFDAGRYDDGVDACSAFGRYIDKIWEQTPPKPEAPLKIEAQPQVIDNFFRRPSEW